MQFGRSNDPTPPAAPPSPYGDEPGPDYPVARAMWRTLTDEGQHKHSKQALLDAVLCLEERTLALEQRLGHED